MKAAKKLVRGGQIYNGQICPIVTFALKKKSYLYHNGIWKSLTKFVLHSDGQTDRQNPQKEKRVN